MRVETEPCDFWLASIKRDIVREVTIAHKEKVVNKQKRGFWYYILDKKNWRDKRKF